jgi:hypothetical protein
MPRQKSNIKKEGHFVSLIDGTGERVMDKLKERGDKSILKNKWFSNYVQRLIDKDLEK